MVATKVSFIDNFKMPLREIEAKFTKSELVLIAWRSQEQYVEMQRGIKDRRDKIKDKAPLKFKVTVPQASDDDETHEISLPAKVGKDRNLGKLSGVEAANVLRRMGILNVPAI